MQAPIAITKQVMTDRPYLCYMEPIRHHQQNKRQDITSILLVCPTDCCTVMSPFVEAQKDKRRKQQQLSQEGMLAQRFMDLLYFPDCVV